MAKLPLKKGPRMTTCLHTDHTNEEVIDDEVASFAYKLHDAIEEARSRMTEKEREKADRGANVVLDEASAAVQRSRRRA